MLQEKLLNQTAVNTRIWYLVIKYQDYFHYNKYSKNLQIIKGPLHDFLQIFLSVQNMFTSYCVKLLVV